MKAIILAAGSGERLKPYTANKPKGMLKFDGETLIQRQINQYRQNGIKDISVVTGFQSKKIKYRNVDYFHSEDYRTTNMLESLMAARSKLEGDVIVSYADLVFEERILQYALGDKSEVGVVVDIAWKDYWMDRFGSTNIDIEGLKLASDGKVTEIGKPESSSENIDGRYVGLIKFSPIGTKNLLSVYDDARAKFWDKPWQTSRSFQKAYMTDMLQALIENGTDVRSIETEGGWLEFDTVEDYEKFGDTAKSVVKKQLQPKQDS